MKTRPEPWTSFVPRLVTMFSVTPAVAMDGSLPPVTTCISWNASKSQYVGEDAPEAMSETVTPSRFQEPWVVCAPLATKIDCWPLWLPPTFTRSTMTDGTDCNMTHGSRALGTFSISTRATLVPVPALRVSISGASAVTVIDSATAGFSIIVMSAFCATRTPMPDRVDMP